MDPALYIKGSAPPHLRPAWRWPGTAGREAEARAPEELAEEVEVTA